MSFHYSLSSRYSQPLVLRIASIVVFGFIIYQLFSLFSKRHTTTWVDPHIYKSAPIPPAFKPVAAPPAHTPIAVPVPPGKSTTLLPDKPVISSPNEPVVSLPSKPIVPSPSRSLVSSSSKPHSSIHASPSAVSLFDQPFPRRLWQTSQHGFTALSDEDKDLLQSWINLNPTWRYEAITAETQDNYVTDSYSDQPEILDMFKMLKDPILRADMVRYLVLLKDGGVYSDSDTKALKPIETWIPERYQKSANVVIGIEYDVQDGQRWADWTMDLQFTTWTMLTKPNHPLLRETVQSLMKGINGIAAKQNTTIDKLELSFSQVLDTTGPAMFSRTTYDYLSRNGTPLTWKSLTGLKEPLLLEDVLILPVTSFGCGQSHSNAGNPDDPSAFVQHMFHGSWKQDHSLTEERKKKEKEEQEKAKEEEAKKQRAEERRKKAAEKKPQNEQHKEDDRT